MYFLAYINNLKWINSLNTQNVFLVLFTLIFAIPSVLLAASFQLRQIASQLHSQVYSYTNFLFEDFFWTSTEKSVSLFNLGNLENVSQRNLRTGTARECIFRAYGGTRFKNSHQPWWWKGWGETPSCNQSAQKNSVKVLLSPKFLLKFYSKGRHMSFQTISIHILLESVFRSLMIAPGPGNEL